MPFLLDGYISFVSPALFFPLDSWQVISPPLSLTSSRILLKEKIVKSDLLLTEKIVKFCVQRGEESKRGERDTEREGGSEGGREGD